MLWYPNGFVHFSRLSVQPYRVGVPLLLKDMTSLLIQLVLTLPATIERGKSSFQYLGNLRMVMGLPIALAALLLP